MKRRLRVTATLLLLACLGSGCRRASQVAAPVGELLWSDEFAGAAGAAPNPLKWRYDVGTDWGNAQLEYDTTRPENVSLDGAGNLAITARAESYLGRSFTSARINTRGLYEPTYGRIEARIKLPAGQGIWPAFWLLGGNLTTVGWPACGEIDVMEYRGQERNKVWGTLHGPGYSGAGGLTTPFVLPSGNFDEAFHVFSVEWSADRVVWRVDGTTYKTATRASLPAGGTWAFNHPFSIILNVAVGGNYVGPPDGTTTFPQTMLVDWVRVYRIGA